MSSGNYLREFLEKEGKRIEDPRKYIPNKLSTARRPKNSIADRYGIDETIISANLPNIDDFLNAHDQFPKRIRNNPRIRYSTYDGYHRELMLPGKRETCIPSYKPRVNEKSFSYYYNSN